TFRRRGQISLGHTGRVHGDRKLDPPWPALEGRERTHDDVRGALTVELDAGPLAEDVEVQAAPYECGVARGDVHVLRDLVEREVEHVARDGYLREDVGAEDPRVQ